MRDIAGPTGNAWDAELILHGILIAVWYAAGIALKPRIVALIGAPGDGRIRSHARKSGLVETAAC